MTEIERYITIASLVNAAVFYAIIVVVFLTARKTRLNVALAAQKAEWLLLILAVALPAFIFAGGRPVTPGWLRMTIWTVLSITTWWVLYEVYMANWQGNFGEFLRHLAWLGKCKLWQLWAIIRRQPHSKC